MRRTIGRNVAGFTLIELLVVVAIIALLISILLPSLSKAREQAKAAVCASRLKSFGQASALYESECRSLAPCDPWPLMPDEPAGYPALGRNPNSWGQRVDPAHGWLAVYAMRIKAHIADETLKPWEPYPYGFRIQSQTNPDDLWDGFFCPSQNKRNTMTQESPELDPFDVYEGYPTMYKHASGYMVNRILRSATNRGRHVPKPSYSYQTSTSGAGAHDNIFGSCVVVLDAGKGTRDFDVQGVTTDELVAAADIAYMADSLDYHTDNSTVQQPFDGGSQSAGGWYMQRGGGPPMAVILGARHNGKANVLYANAHVTRDNLVPRNLRGDLVVASTFADFTSQNDLGSQHHLMPCWRRFMDN